MKLKDVLRKKPSPVPSRMRIHEKFDRKSVIVHHYCPFTRNAGDHFVIQSIRKHLREHLPEAVFYPKAIANNRGWGKPVGLHDENIPLSNRYADAIVVGGSDQYKNWSPRIRAEEVVHLAPPLFLVGLGASSKAVGEPPIMEKQRYIEDILATHRVAAGSSVRDHMTLRWLQDIGVQNVKLTGCPANFMFDKPMMPRPQGAPIMLTFPYPLTRRKHTLSKHQRLVKLMHEIIKWLDDRGEQSVIVCHDDRDLLWAQEEFVDRKLFFSDYVEDYYTLYDSARLVVGSRLHATILASGMGVPILNVNLDMRGAGFSETYDLKDWNLNLQDNDIRDDVIGRLEKLLSDDLTMFAGFTMRRDELKQTFHAFMKDCAGVIRQRVGLQDETPLSQ